RGERYRDAGADMVFIEAPQSVEEIEQIAARFDCPLLFNWADTGKTPPMPLARLEALGYKLVIYPVTTLYVATKAMMRAMESLRRVGTSAEIGGDLVTFNEFNSFIGLEQVQEMEQRYAVAGAGV
ncbi:MAG: isocitrate lyase/phosphoenolpyruvate mutase family protein, partial [Dehalococcoidia bacterium]